MQLIKSDNPGNSPFICLILYWGLTLYYFCWLIISLRKFFPWECGLWGELKDGGEESLLIQNINRVLIRHESIQVLQRLHAAGNINKLFSTHTDEILTSQLFPHIRKWKTISIWKYWTAIKEKINNLERLMYLIFKIFYNTSDK